jgi:hypothetical protein
MKSLYEPSSAAEIQQRIAALRPDSPRQWGAMTVAQMLAHCSEWMETATGQKNPPRIFLGRIFGPIAKKSLLSEKPIRRNLPTAPSLLIRDDKTFAAEQRRLLDLVARFSSAGPTQCTTHPHCFFGRLTPEEWATMGYKHLHHHLSQFSA